MATHLDKCSKQELIETVLSLESRVKQLETLLNWSQDNITHTKPMKTQREPHPKRARIFNFAKYKRRHVAIKLLYLGWNYKGFVTQEDTTSTIENALFEALIKTRLISSREESNYHRCGRTDKGVSAFSQVISLDLRTNLISGKGVITPADYEPTDNGLPPVNDEANEINYISILNGVLPPEIRVICWSPVDTSFSSRFDCKSRTYKYLFPIASLNVERIRVACDHLCGEHDFRNFCKMDVNNGVINYKRKILSVDLRTINDDNCVNNDGYCVCELTITGQAFLWHQIRCIVAVLFLIGCGDEEPDIIKKLLDITQNPLKPQYCMAVDFPLVLFDCQYNDCDVKQWIYDTKALYDLIRHLQGLWTREAVKAHMIKLMLNNLTHELKSRCNQSDSDGVAYNLLCQTDVLNMGVKSKVYKSLLERPFCDSLEQRLSKVNKKKKL